MKNGRIWVLMLVISINVISLVDAQIFPICADHILPCINYANSTKPPDFCCNIVKDLSTTHKTCICQLAITPELFEGFGIKTAQAYRFLHSCGVKFDFSFCKASSPSPLSEQPPAITRGDEGGADKIDINGVCFMLFIGIYVVLLGRD